MTDIVEAGSTDIVRASSAPLAFVDCETSGLDPEHHEVWEVAVLFDPPAVTPRGEWVREKVWQLPVDLGRADLISLNVGRWRERYNRARVVSRLEFAEEFSLWTWGRHLVGAVPSFDAERLFRLLRSEGQVAGWHYHLVDVEALAVGWCRGRVSMGHRPYPVAGLPWKTSELYRAVGVNVEDFDTHTALGDVRMAKAVYDAVMG